MMGACSPNTPSRSYQLPLLHVKILRDELRAQFFVVEQRKAHAAPLQDSFQLTQLVPEQVPTQLLVNLIERRHGPVRKERSNTGRLEHVHEDQVLAADQIQVANETLGENRVVQRRQKNQQPPPAQAQPDDRAQFVEV